MRRGNLFELVLSLRDYRVTSLKFLVMTIRMKYEIEMQKKNTSLRGM